MCGKCYDRLARHGEDPKESTAESTGHAVVGGWVRKDLGDEVVVDTVFQDKCGSGGVPETRWEPRGTGSMAHPVRTGAGAEKGGGGRVPDHTARERLEMCLEMKPRTPDAMPECALHPEGRGVHRGFQTGRNMVRLAFLKDHSGSQHEGWTRWMRACRTLVCKDTRREGVSWSRCEMMRA